MRWVRCVCTLFEGFKRANMADIWYSRGMAILGVTVCIGARPGIAVGTTWVWPSPLMEFHLHLTCDEWRNPTGGSSIL